MESPEVDGGMQLTCKANTEQPKLAPERTVSSSLVGGRHDGVHHDGAAGQRPP